MGTLFQEIKKRGRNPIVKKVTQGSNGKAAITSEMIAKKAYELYEKRGCRLGFELQDWEEAKKILEAGNEKKDTTGG